MKRLFVILLLGCVSRLYASEPMFTLSAELPSLCDEWNVAEKIQGIYHTFKWRLTTDTIINANHYVKIERNRQYKGALREDDNANIFIVPSDSTKEFLLYAFHAQEGDTLINTCLGERIIVKEIRPTTPRTFVLDVEYEWYEWSNDHYEAHTDYWNVNWIEGIGYIIGTPISYAYLLGSIHELDPPAMTVCAYKNGEQVYKGEYAERFGCEYNLQDDRLEDIHIVTTSNNPSASKYIRDGRLVIEREGKIYDATGAEVR